MNKFKTLDAFIGTKKAGTLAVTKDGLVAFEYDEDWLQNGFSISPFSLPLEKRVFIPKSNPFEGLFGVFADSLPDGWGRLLVDRLLLREQINPYTIDNLNRLAIVGASGMGALSYQPAHRLENEGVMQDYDHISAECQKLLTTNYSDDLDELFRLGGSSGGARPKILTTYKGEDWIIKFPSAADKDNIGEIEYRYSQCAKRCGIEMAETKLFPSRKCAGYFGTKRFDRVSDSNGQIQKIHMLSVSAILETSHRIPNLDYNILMKLTLNLTKDYSEVEKMYRLMCFNVFSHNRDDHSKNFTYLYHEKQGTWRLSPAYDLTYSHSIGGEHATCINGNGKNPSMNDILKVADYIGLSKEISKRIAEEIREIVNEESII